MIYLIFLLIRKIFLLNKFQHKWSILIPSAWIFIRNQWWKASVTLFIWSCWMMFQTSMRRDFISSNVKNMHFVGHFCFNNEKNTINDQKTYFMGDGIMWKCTYLCFVFSFCIWLPKNWNYIQLLFFLHFFYISISCSLQIL